MGVAAEEAPGAAAPRLGKLPGRPLTIRQGRGSRIDVRPGGMVEVGGRVAYLEIRTHDVPDS